MSALHDTIPDVRVEPQPLGQILASAEAAGLLVVPPGVSGVEITDVVSDSRLATPGALFAALSSDGDGPDGDEFVDRAFRAGAVAALVSESLLAESLREGIVPDRGGVVVPSTDTRAAVAHAAATLYGRPGDAMTLVGITGTNGKTTTTTLVHGMVSRLGGVAGLVGTVENRIGAERYATRYTTPEAPELQRLLRAMAQAGVSTVAMEVSSHGLALHRVGTLRFQVAAFTNLTHDHLDFHRTPEAYADAKRLLFDGLDSDAAAVVNADSPAWRTMTSRTAARVVTVGTGAEANIRFETLANTLDGLTLRLDGQTVRFALAGRFNAFNLALAYAVGRELGYGAAETLGALAAAEGVPGRFETVNRGGAVLGVVDYAHTPDALDNVLATAREIVPAGGRLAVVFGCGGDRDRAKRPEMARVAEARADRVIVTSDNPRTESPEAILADIRAGLARPESAAFVVDRAHAIQLAAREARPGDVVVVAGKGHETYQIVGQTRLPFDDREVLRDALDVNAESRPEHVPV